MLSHELVLLAHWGGFAANVVTLAGCGELHQIYLVPCLSGSRSRSGSAWLSARLLLIDTKHVADVLKDPTMLLRSSDSFVTLHGLVILIEPLVFLLWCVGCSRILRSLLRLIPTAFWPLRRWLASTLFVWRGSPRTLRPFSLYLEVDFLDRRWRNLISLACSTSTVHYSLSNHVSILAVLNVWYLLLPFRALDVTKIIVELGSEDGF